MRVHDTPKSFYAFIGSLMAYTYFQSITCLDGGNHSYLEFEDMKYHFCVACSRVGESAGVSHLANQF